MTALPEMDAHEWMLVTEQIIDAANTTPWVWRRHELSPFGHCTCIAKEWIGFRMKHTLYRDTEEELETLLTGLGFIHIREAFAGPHLIPQYWRPTDGAWAHTVPGAPGISDPTVDALSSIGEEIDLEATA